MKKKNKKLNKNWRERDSQWIQNAKKKEGQKVRGGGDG